MLWAVTILATATAAVSSAQPSCPTIDVDAGAKLAVSIDIKGAVASYAEGQWGLGLTFRPEAGARLRAYTAQHVGQPITVTISGQAVRHLKILDPLTGDQLWITPMSEVDAKSLADRIDSCAKA